MAMYSLTQLMDMRSLSFYTVFVHVLFGAALLSYALIQRKFRCIAFLAIADFLAGGGFFFLCLRDYVSVFLSIIAAHVLLFAAFVLNYEGIRLFLGKPRRYGVLSILLFTVLILSFAYFTFVQPSVTARIVVVSVIAAIICAAMVHLLLHESPRESLVPLSVAAGGFALYGVFMLLRIFWALTQPPLEKFFEGGIIHALTFFVASILVATNGLGILWAADAKLESELLRQARIDSLTGLYNRRALDELAEREVSRSLRNGSPLSFIMADIDHFKLINDSFGHKTGDSVLTAVASLMSHSLRKQDILARYGGEEFLIILPDTDKFQALTAAEKLRTAFVHEVFHCCSARITLSLSFGVSCLGVDGTTVDQVIDRADDALYEAKQGGRNKVVALSSRPC